MTKKDDFLNRARTFKLSNDMISAEENYKKALQLFSGDGNLLFEVGNFYYEIKNFTLAIKYYEECLEFQSNNPEVHNNLGEVYLLTNDMDKAFEKFNEIIRLFPKYPYGYYNLALVLQKRGDSKKAIEYFNKAIKLNNREAKFYNSLSAAFCDEGNLNKAVSCLEKAIKLDNSYVMAYINLSKVYLLQKKYALALSICEKAPVSSDPLIYNQLGAIYQKQAQYDIAVTHYLKALDLAPEMAQVHYNLGTLFETKRFFSRAIYHYNSYLEITGTEYSPLGKEIKNKIEELKETPEFHLEQGIALHAKNQDEDAIKMWQKALEIDPEFFHANILLGALYEKTEKYEKARKEYERVIELKPEMEGIKRSLEKMVMRDA